MKPIVNKDMEEGIMVSVIIVLHGRECRFCSEPAPPQGKPESTATAPNQRSDQNNPHLPQSGSHPKGDFHSLRLPKTLSILSLCPLLPPMYLPSRHRRGSQGRVPLAHFLPQSPRLPLKPRHRVLRQMPMSTRRPRTVRRNAPTRWRHLERSHHCLLPIGFPQPGFFLVPVDD